MKSDRNQRIQTFCERYRLLVPILESPMAGACPPELAAAVANAGGMGGMGALLSTPHEIAGWIDAFRRLSAGSVQLNVWIPDATGGDVAFDPELPAHLWRWGVPSEPSSPPPAIDFDVQCSALLEARPDVVSSIMGIFKPAYVAELKRAGIGWFACATTLDEARAAEAAGADAIVAQSIEAGGHRGTFEPADGGREGVGMVALLPWFVDHLKIPVSATGGIGDGRGAAAALALGATAVQIGTAYLRSPEAGLHSAWSAAMVDLDPQATVLTRAFTGRWARAIGNDFTRSFAVAGAPQPAAHPLQRHLTQPLKDTAKRTGDETRMQLWAGQSAALATTADAGSITRKIWRDAQVLLGGP